MKKLLILLFSLFLLSSPSVFAENKITVDEYFKDGISYGSQRITLVGEVEDTWVTLIDEFGIDLVSKNGKIISAFLTQDKWKNDDSMTEKLNSIKMGDSIKLKGQFLIEMGFPVFNILKILE